MLKLDALSISTAHGQRILAPLTLEIPDGRGLFVVGESGSGKTSLLEALAGVSRHRLEGTGCKSGLLAVQDAASAFSPYRRLGAQVRDAAGWDPGADARLARILAQVGLDPAAALAAYPHELSGGMLKRCLAAGVLAVGADLSLFDEPTAGVDYRWRWALLDAIRRWSPSFVLATHDVELVRRGASPDDHLLVLLHGEAVASGPAEHVLTHPSHPYVAALFDLRTGGAHV